MLLTDSELNRMKAAALKKKEMLEGIYDITKRRKFKGEESEIEQFADYLNIREPYIQEYADFVEGEGSCLNGFEPSFSNQSEIYKEVSQLVENNEDIRQEIIKMDKENNANMQKVKDYLSGEVMKLNKTKKARMSYGFFQAQGDLSKQSQAYK